MNFLVPYKQAPILAPTDYVEQLTMLQAIFRRIYYEQQDAYLTTIEINPAFEKLVSTDFYKLYMMFYKALIFNYAKEKIKTNPSTTHNSTSRNFIPSFTIDDHTFYSHSFYDSFPDHIILIDKELLVQHRPSLYQLIYNYWFSLPSPDVKQAIFDNENKVNIMILYILHFGNDHDYRFIKTFFGNQCANMQRYACI
jgi:hypothetical protein